MLLPTLLLLLFVGGLLAALLASWRPTLPRWIALVATALALALTAIEWARAGGLDLRLPALAQPPAAAASAWLVQYRVRWLPALGIQFHLALDGLSLLLLVLTFFLGLMAVLLSWKIEERPGFFFLNLLWMLTGIAGILLAVDLFLFYVAWEVMLVPLYFLIVLWGGEQRTRAGMQFFLFTQASGLLMLLAILALAFAHHPAAGRWSFEYADLLGTRLAPAAGIWIMLGFLAAFAVKLPLFPLHTWQPTAFVAAPIGACITGLLLEIGGYGLIRFLFPLLPAAAHAAAPVVMLLAVITILYGALVALGQDDLKRLIAYGSIAHVGFVALGIFAWNQVALEGAVMLMIAHALSTGALFIMMGIIRDRTRSSSLDPLGGLWSVAPTLSALTLFFVVASIGLPGLADFVGEFLILLGTYRASPVLAALAALGVLLSTLYALRLLQRVVQGPEKRSWEFRDLSWKEAGILLPFVAGLVFFGVYPRPILNTFRPVMQRLIQATAPSIPPLQSAIDHAGEPTGQNSRRLHLERSTEERRGKRVEDSVTVSSTRILAAGRPLSLPKDAAEKGIQPRWPVPRSFSPGPLRKISHRIPESRRQSGYREMALFSLPSSLFSLLPCEKYLTSPDNSLADNAARRLSNGGRP